MLRSLPEDDGEPVQPLLSSESLEWDAIANLDDFFRRIYKYGHSSCCARYKLDLESYCVTLN